MFKLGSKSIGVDVTVLPGQNPNFQFSSKIWQNNKLVFENNGYDGFYVSFRLKESDPQYYFAADEKDALAAKKLVTPGDSCPDQGAPVWNQFKAKEVTDELRTLVVHDPNSPGQECEFGFSLFVTTNDDGSGPYLKLDPIGDNHNGQTKLNLAAVATATVAVAAVAVVALYAFGVLGE